MTPAPPAWTWQQISRAVGLTIVLVLLVVFVISFFTKITLDTTLTLAFLTIASFLLGAPSGFQLLIRRNGDGSSK